MSYATLKQAHNADLKGGLVHQNIYTWRIYEIATNRLKESTLQTRLNVA